MNKSLIRNHGLLILLLKILTEISFILPSCGGGEGGGNDENTDPHEVKLTATMLSSDSIQLSWTNPTTHYSWPAELVLCEY